MGNGLDDPQVRQRTVRALLITAPLLFVGGYLLAAVQGASAGLSLLLAGISLAMCLGTALCIHLLGSKSGVVLVALSWIMALFARR